MALELRGSAPYYDGQIIAVRNNSGGLDYAQVHFNEGGGYSTSPIDMKSAQQIAQENFDKYSNYDLKTGDAEGVRMVYVRPAKDKPVPTDNNSGYTVEPIKAGIDYSQSYNPNTDVTPTSTQEPVNVEKPTTVAPVTRPTNTAPEVKLAPINQQYTTLTPLNNRISSTPINDRQATLDSYKRLLEQAPYTSRTNPNINKSTDYVFNLDKPPIPSSRDKMWEMAIARQNSLGNKLPSSRFNGGQYGI
jgi:hypothetical protein